MDDDPQRRSEVWAVATLVEVQANLHATGYPLDHVHCVQGDVEQTLPRQAPEEAIVNALIAAETMVGAACLIPTGSVSVTSTSRAAACPVLVIVVVYRTFPPGSSGFGTVVAVFVSASRGAV